MLYALTKDSKMITAKAATKEQKYYCPSCHEPVILRQGHYYMAHFAHLKRTCGTFSEGETNEHLRGKKLLATFFRAFGARVKLEAYLPGSKQRPDLLVQLPDQQLLALEYQCAPLSLRKLQKRSRGYHDVGLAELWILGNNYRLKRSLPQQVAQFMRWSKNRGFYLIYLDPIKAYFEVVYGIQKADFLPLKYQYWRTNDVKKLKAFFATPQKIRLKHLSLSERKKQKYALAKQIYYSTGAMRKLQQLTYQKRLKLTAVIDDCLALNYSYPLYRTATLWWRTALYCDQFSRPKIPAYELVFVDLKPFIEQDIDNFCKGLAFLKKNF